MYSPLVGFSGMNVQPVGTVTLPVVVGAYPQQVAKDVNFLVVDCSSSYNAIIGKPTLNSYVYLPFISQIPNGEQGGKSTRRSIGSQRMLFSNVGHG